MKEHEEKKVRSLAESVIFYVGIPAAALYPLVCILRLYSPNLVKGQFCQVRMAPVPTPKAAASFTLPF